MRSPQNCCEAPARRNVSAGKTWGWTVVRVKSLSSGEQTHDSLPRFLLAFHQWKTGDNFRNLRKLWASRPNKQILDPDSTSRWRFNSRTSLLPNFTCPKLQFSHWVKTSFSPRKIATLINLFHGLLPLPIRGSDSPPRKKVFENHICWTNYLCTYVNMYIYIYHLSLKQGKN